MMTRKEFKAAYAPIVTESKPSWFAVFEWAGGEGRYRLADAIGARVFKTRRGADAFLAKLETSSPMLEGGLVSRSNQCVDARHCTISGSGRVELTTPCTCPLPNAHHDTQCAYHLSVGFTTKETR